MVPMHCYFLSSLTACFSLGNKHCMISKERVAACIESNWSIYRRLAIYHIISSVSIGMHYRDCKY